MVSGEGIIKSKDTNLLKENGGGIEITKGWVQSLLRHMLWRNVRIVARIT